MFFCDIFLPNSSQILFLMNKFEQIRHHFSKSGISISSWAKENGFPPDLVYKVLNNNRVPLRGKSHQIAVKLGIKE